MKMTDRDIILHVVTLFLECLDVAIVGGGIGGTYTGWRLRNRGLKVSIFENTNRVGGRMFSVFLPSAPGVPLDLGAMRFKPDDHTVLVGLLKTLGLESTVFRPNQHEKTYYLRGKRLSFADLLTDKLPYNLRPGEPKDPDQLLWTFYQAAMNRSDPDRVANPEDGITLDRLPLYKQGYLDLMGKIWSNEAKQYLKDFIAFHSDFENNNAVHNTPVSRPSASADGSDIRTVIGGMNAVSRRLGEQFLAASNRHSIRLNQRVSAIQRKRRWGRRIYDLTIVHTSTVDGHTIDAKKKSAKVCAKEVILACPRTALTRIKWAPFQQNPRVLYALKSVSDNSAMKIFLVYPNVWMDQNGGYKSIVSDTQLLQTFLYSRFRNRSGHENSVVLASYADGETLMDYWSELRKHPGTVSSPSVPPAYAVSKKVVEHVHHHLAGIFDLRPGDIPEPLDGVMHIWRDGDYGSAWELFKPGFKPSLVEAFMRRPSPSDRVFVVSNSYSVGLTFWAEGTLRAADAVLNQFFSK